MGYYIYFINNNVHLNRNLTDTETEEFNIINENFESWWEIRQKEISWINESFLCIYDEDEIKGYNWKDELKSILELFSSFWVIVNGFISWDGEESWDIGVCYIKDNKASVSRYYDPMKVADHLRNAWFEDAAKSIEYYYCDEL